MSLFYQEKLPFRNFKSLKLLTFLNRQIARFARPTLSGSKPSIRSIVRRWLEDYVVEHGIMPYGAHEVSVPFLGGRISAGTINFSDLPSGE
jgi:hypothetical protein